VFSVPPKMRAVLIKDEKGPAENLYMGEEATPEPKQGEVQVKVSRPRTYL
jgi:NADPH:quinone reductase-like Zn-dependent oxidoreductase